MTAALLLVIGFTYSDDIVELALNLGAEPIRRRWTVAGVRPGQSAGGGTAVLKWRISGQAGPEDLLRGLVTGYWGLGAALVVVSHLVLIATAAPPARLGHPRRWGEPAVHDGVRHRDGVVADLSAQRSGPPRRHADGWCRWCWGTLVAQFASALWYPVIDPEEGCS